MKPSAFLRILCFSFALPGAVVFAQDAQVQQPAAVSALTSIAKEWNPKVDVQYLGASDGGWGLDYSFKYSKIAPDSTLPTKDGTWTFTGGQVQFTGSGQLTSTAKDNQQAAAKLSLNAGGGFNYDAGSVVGFSPTTGVIIDPVRMSEGFGGSIELFNLAFQAAQQSGNYQFSVGPKFDINLRYLQRWNSDANRIRMGRIQLQFGYNYLLSQKYDTTLLTEETSGRKNVAAGTIELTPSSFYNLFDVSVRYDGNYYLQQSVPKDSLPHYADSVYAQIRLLPALTNTFPSTISGLFDKNVTPCITYEHGKLAPLVKQTGTAIGAGFTVNFGPGATTGK